jgi:hypothetical protein
MDARMRPLKDIIGYYFQSASRSGADLEQPETVA